MLVGGGNLLLDLDRGLWYDLRMNLMLMLITKILLLLTGIAPLTPPPAAPPILAPALAPPMGDAGKPLCTGDLTIDEFLPGKSFPCDIAPPYRLNLMMRFRPSIIEQIAICDAHGGHLIETNDGLNQICEGIDY